MFPPHVSPSPGAWVSHPRPGQGGEGMGKSLRWYDKFVLLHNQDRLPIRIDGREGSWEGGAAGFFSPRGKVPACPGQFIFFKTVVRALLIGVAAWDPPSKLHVNYWNLNLTTGISK